MHRRRIALWAALPLLALPGSLFGPTGLNAQTDLLTIAESTGFTATSRHADVLAFAMELQRTSPLVRVETMAVSAEGRAVPLIVIGDPVPSSPLDLRYDDRAVVYFQANIHAGEVEGKEAALMLARDLVEGATPAYLDRLVILIAPIFNTDGNEKISTGNRTNQVGPDQGVGIRYNGQNLDLNRDGMKMESPEVQGLVEKVLLRWDPILFLDSHTHNGSYHQEPVTWTWGLNPNGDQGILAYCADELLPDITRRMREDYGILSVPHGDFIDPMEPARGWVPLGPQPRYLSNYVGLRNRISILNEQYPYVDFETRVKGAYALFSSFLDHTYASKDRLVALVREADGAPARRVSSGAGGAFALEFEAEAIDLPITIQGYEMELVQGQGPRTRARPTETLRTYPDLPYLADWTPTRTVPLPAGYLMAVNEPAVIQKLLQHGISVERLVEGATLEVERFSVTEATGSSRLNQGHYNTTISGEYSTVEMEFEPGTHFVTMAQALAPLVASLLEPESDDGLVYWNFFDRHLATQWSREAQVYPVFKLHNSANLVTEAVIR